MPYLELLAFYHWIIIGFGFFLLEITKIGGISTPGTIVAIVLAVVTYIYPEMPWWEQVWAFVMLTALASIIYLRRKREGDPKAKDLILSPDVQASYLKGVTVTLKNVLPAGESKLQIRGKFWKVITSRGHPAGTIVEVTGHRGAVLELSSREQPGYAISARHSDTGVAFSEYARDKKVEREYGEPDFDYWVLFHAALQSHSKFALVQAYHLISGLSGVPLEEARRRLNTCTLALYDRKDEGRYQTLGENHYSEPRVYQFLYGDGQWTARHDEKFEDQMDQLEACLSTPWADKLRGTLPLELTETALRMLRDGKLAEDDTAANG
jgi:inner membrane protein